MILDFQKLEVFPTTLIRFNLNHIFTDNEVCLMVNDINKWIDEKENLQLNEFTPKWQSVPFLFTEKNIEDKLHWKKLKTSFEHACFQYVQTVPNFCNNQNQLDCVHSRAWFYKKDSTTFNEDNPWHNHYPSFLSGVFYLKGNNDRDTFIPGTVFCDPRQPPSSSTRDVQVEGLTLSWLIFPGWMTHKSSRSVDEKNSERYVVAADCYVKAL